MAGATWFVNRVVLVGVFGGSCGMLLSGVRTRLQNGARMGLGVALVRGALGALLAPVAPLALGDPEGRAPADRIVGTRVVQVGGSSDAS
jgi:hypothetical protein